MSNKIVLNAEPKGRYEAIPLPIVHCDFYADTPRERKYMGVDPGAAEGDQTVTVVELPPIKEWARRILFYGAPRPNPLDYQIIDLCLDPPADEPTIVEQKQ